MADGDDDDVVGDFVGAMVIARLVIQSLKKTARRSVVWRLAREESYGNRYDKKMMFLLNLPTHRGSQRNPRDGPHTGPYMVPCT